MQNNKKSIWAAPIPAGIRSVDVSAVVYKMMVKESAYMRTPTYRKRKSISLKGMTDSECY
jgi:hypothetical protein